MWTPIQENIMVYLPKGSDKEAPFRSIINHILSGFLSTKYSMIILTSKQQRTPNFGFEA
jgi:hypothetical protein